jgi:hypothetical protein
MSRWALLVVGAWVLWQHNVVARERQAEENWWPLGGFEGRAECVTERDKHIRDVRSYGASLKDIQTVPNEWGADTVFKGGTVLSNQFICLPDWTDPRRGVSNDAGGAKEG